MSKKEKKQPGEIKVRHSKTGTSIELKGSSAMAFFQALANGEASSQAMGKAIEALPEEKKE